MKKTSICPHCHKEFSYYTSQAHNGIKRFCSRKCFQEASRATTNCAHCGKEILYYKRYPRTYCSRQCANAVNAKKNLGIIELPTMFCEICGVELTGQKWVDRRFCSRACFGKHLSMTLKGIPRPAVCGERPDLQKRVTLTCPQCGKEFAVKESQSSRRRFCCKQCHAQWQSESGIYSGENNHNWRGGYEPYYGANWQTQRRNARRRDRYTCQKCGITESELGKQLDVHHITPFREFGIERYKEANRIANLVSLCNKCHTSEFHHQSITPPPVAQFP